eukprot:4110865-Pyramimonas_sp.AAC.1
MHTSERCQDKTVADFRSTYRFPEPQLDWAPFSHLDNPVADNYHEVGPVALQEECSKIVEQ